MSASSPLDIPQAQRADALRSPRGIVAWVDGAGAFLLCLNDRVTLGGLAGNSDVRVTSDLVAEHATIERSGEGYLIEATGPTIVTGDARRQGSSRPEKSKNPGQGHSSGRVVEGRTDLGNDDELVLFREGGGAVRLRFRKPNPLAATATLVIASDHRTEPRYDGIVLLADTCVLGPGTDAHIRCRHSNDTMLLFRRDGQLWCKSPYPVEKNGHRQNNPVPVRPGDHITSSEISFRLEAVSLREHPCERVGDIHKLT